MKFKFIGIYPSGYTSINAGGVMFYGNEASDVEDEDTIRRLSGHPEFKVVGKLKQLDHDGDGVEGGSKAPEGDKDDLKALREEYEFKLGKKPFPGWNAETLRAKMA